MIHGSGVTMTTTTNKAKIMAAETSAGVVWGVKSGILAGVFLLAVSVLAVVVGLTIVPPAKGREREDIARRLAAGLLCSFTLGPYLAFKFIEVQPGFLEFWVKILGAEHSLWAYLATAAPFLAATALPGFWVVAAAMRWFQKREGKDIKELIDEARG
jgi:hypothetical protein